MTLIKSMEVMDIQAITLLEMENFTTPWKKEDFMNMLSVPYVSFWVAYEGDELLGYIGLRNIAGEGEITNVSVRNTKHRQGIGTLLLHYLIQKGGEMGIEAYTLEVRASNDKAIALYEKFGFSGEGRRKDFYDKPKEDALIMWKR